MVSIANIPSLPTLLIAASNNAPVHPRVNLSAMTNVNPKWLEARHQAVLTLNKPKQDFHGIKQKIFYPSPMEHDSHPIVDVLSPALTITTDTNVRAAFLALAKWTLPVQETAESLAPIHSGKLFQLGALTLAGLDANEAEQYASKSVSPWIRNVDIMMVGGQLKDTAVLKQLIDITWPRVVLFSMARKSSLDGYGLGKAWMLDLGRSRNSHAQIQYGSPEHPDTMTITVHSSRRIRHTQSFSLDKDKRIQFVLKNKYRGVVIESLFRQLASELGDSQEVFSRAVAAASLVTAAAANYLAFLDRHPTPNHEEREKALESLWKNKIAQPMVKMALFGGSKTEEMVRETIADAALAFAFYLKAWGMK